jgi:hypothetical protein
VRSADAQRRPAATTIFNLFFVMTAPYSLLQASLRDEKRKIASAAPLAGVISDKLEGAPNNLL